MADCTQCADYEWCAKNEECGMFKPKPITNYDILRAKSVEEMAGWLAKHNERSAVCPNFGAHDCQASCKQCWLDWLRQEVSANG